MSKFILQLLFNVSMIIITPIRKKGLFGTSDDPKEYLKGDEVPWHIEHRLFLPFSTKIIFTVDVESYYENGNQVLRPLFENPTPYVMEANHKHGVIVGAPTMVINIPRHKQPNLRLVTNHE